MRLNAKQFLVAAALVAMAVPVWGATTELHSDGNVVVGQTQLKAGDYELRVKDNAPQLEVTKDGKVVAEAPITWIQLPKKPQATEVVMDQNRVVEVDFGGKTQAVKVQTNQANSNPTSDQSGQQ
jgi:hypothetical protein